MQKIAKSIPDSLLEAQIRAKRLFYIYPNINQQNKVRLFKLCVETEFDDGINLFMSKEILTKEQILEVKPLKIAI